MLSPNQCNTYLEKPDTPDRNRQRRERQPRKHRWIIFSAPIPPVRRPPGQRSPTDSTPHEPDDLAVHAAREHAEQAPRGYAKDLLSEAALAHGMDAK